MDIDKPVLEHPFYQAWNRGEITTEQLSEYADAYQIFMNKVPSYWERIVEDLGIDEETADEVVAEEQEHADLWKQWRIELPETAEAPALEALLEGLGGMSASELAGALHAYEVQQPEVCETKKKGLLDHYGFDEEPLTFFDEHIDGEEDHIAFGRKIREKYADTEAFDRGFQKGVELVYNSLDNFVAA